MLVFADGGKLENLERNPRSRVENQLKLNLLTALGPGIKPGPHWWEASALTTAPTMPDPKDLWPLAMAPFFGVKSVHHLTEHACYGYIG